MNVLCAQSSSNRFMRKKKKKKLSVSSKLSGAAKPTSLRDEEYRGLKQRTMAYNGDGTLVLMQHLPIVILGKHCQAHCITNSPSCCLSEQSQPFGPVDTFRSSFSVIILQYKYRTSLCFWNTNIISLCNTTSMKTCFFGTRHETFPFFKMYLENISILAKLER